jgi:hypothetical protein
MRSRKMPASEQRVTVANEPDRTGVWIGIVAVLIGLAVGGYTLALALAVHTPVPLFDEWRVLARYVDYLDNKRTLLDFLWEDHFGHRPVMPRLAFMADMKLAWGTQHLPQLLSFVCALATPLILVAGFWAQKRMPQGIRLIGCGLVLIFLLPTQQVWNLSVGWNNSLFLVVLSALTGFATLFHAINRREQKLTFTTPLVASILACIVATITMSNGLLTWPICALGCLAAGRRSWAALFAGLGTIFVSLYLLGFPQASGAIQALRDPIATTRWIAIFLGNLVYIQLPLLGSQTSVVFGSVGIALVLYHLSRTFLSTQPPTRTELFLLAVCALSLGTATLVGLGRTRLGEGALEPLHFRYYTLVAPLWASVSLLSIIRIHSWSDSNAKQRMKIADCCALVICVAACAVTFITSPNSRWLERNLFAWAERSATALIAGAPDDAAMLYLWGFDDLHPRDLVPFLASNRLSIFASSFDRSLHDLFQNSRNHHLPNRLKLGSDRCSGTTTPPVRIEAADHPSASAFNMISARTKAEEAQAVAALAFTDEQGRLVGIGRRASLNRRWLLGSFPNNADYIGYFKVSPDQRVVIHALSTAGEHLCSFPQNVLPASTATVREFPRCKFGPPTVCPRITDWGDAVP